jgi:hypothetical protein
VTPFYRRIVGEGTRWGYPQWLLRRTATSVLEMHVSTVTADYPPYDDARRRSAMTVHLAVLIAFVIGCTNDQTSVVEALPDFEEEQLRSFACPSGQVPCGAGFCMPEGSMCCAGKPGRYCGFGFCSNDGLSCTQPPTPGPCGSNTPCANGCCFAGDACVPTGGTSQCVLLPSMMAEPDPGGGGGGGGGGSCPAGQQLCGSNNCIVSGTTCCTNGALSFGCPVGAECVFSGGTGPGGIDCVINFEGTPPEGPPLRCNSGGAPGLLIILIAFVVAARKRSRR